MKKILTVVLILTFTVSFSQTEKDWTEIINLVIAEYKSDTIRVFHKFDNHKLLSALDVVKSQKDSNIHKGYGTELDSNGIDPNWEIKTARMYDDSVTVEFEKIKVEYFPSITIADKNHHKRIRPFTDLKLQKKKDKPFASISIPLISKEGNKAIVYGSYNCGGLCGSGGVFYVEKVNGKWKVLKYEMRWIS